MSGEKTFAEIVAEAKALPKAASVVRTGGVNLAGDFFDTQGRLVTHVGQITPKQAQEYVAQGALVAFEGCGCGGSAGCAAEWFDSEIREELASKRPKFIKGYGSPTWIEIWQGDGPSVVYAHGDVEWGDVMA